MIVPVWLLVVLTILAVYRLTRLFTEDKITEPIRTFADERSPDQVGYLLSCDWCLSIWLAPPIVATVIVWPDNRVVLGALIALSASGATGLLALWERNHLAVDEDD